MADEAAERLKVAEAEQAEVEKGLRILAALEEKADDLSESEKRELATDLEKVQAAFDQNPMIGYMPHHKQRPLHAAWTRVKAFIAANRAGKTKGAIGDDLIQALDPEWLPPHLLPYKRFEPPFKCRVFTPDLGSTLDEMHEGMQEMVPPGALRGGSWDKAYAKADRILRFANGSFFDFFSYDQDLDQMGSVSRHRIHYDEEPPEAVRKASRKRIIDTGGDELFSFTPELGISWTHDAIFERRFEDHITVVRAGMRDNPYVSEAEIDAYVLDLNEEEKRIALYGEYVAIGGNFYPEFSDEHLIDPPSRDHLKGQSIVVGIDPGLRRPGVVWVAFDNENTALVFDELVPSDLTVDEQARRIKERNAFWGIKPSYIIDPSARNRATVNAESPMSAFSRQGIYCGEGQNDRQTGILEVKRRLQKKELLVSRDCHSLIWEFPRYRRRIDAPSEFDAVKKDDDLLDALRYVLLSRVWISPTSPKKKPIDRPWNYVGPYKPQRSEAPPLGAWT